MACLNKLAVFTPTQKAANVEKARDRAILNSKSLRSDKFTLETMVKKSNKKLDDMELEGIKSKFRKKGLNEEELDVSQNSEQMNVNGKAIGLKNIFSKSFKKIFKKISKIFSILAYIFQTPESHHCGNKIASHVAKKT